MKEIAGRRCVIKGEFLVFVFSNFVFKMRSSRLVLLKCSLLTWEPVRNRTLGPNSRPTESSSSFI
jgi:hypothetical protein